ncbi:hypothetical protein EDD16DRAFT_1526798 [Pisolithus croceorrhizus]|nr:hypothetical protein EV401DRAFT_1895159 [Pisolithus croceorrhizus]KAI6099399.1 hypothetical protein EDD16DRAFT_1526798 [Pisolithus croceorrhizus]KAI6168259.1 hypothetical protein EDD17DRAFT_1503845 [Pisolithus thermaeus]
MKEKLLAALKDLCLTHGIEVSDPQKVAWNQLLKFMWRYHLTIINWPCGVSPPGPGFNHKKLKAGPLCQLVVAYLVKKLGHKYDGQTNDQEEQDSLDDVPEIEIKCWNQDIIDIPDENPLNSKFPLVKAANGTILWKISDDPEWQKSCQERHHQWQDIEAYHLATKGPHTALILKKLAHLTFLLQLHGTGSFVMICYQVMCIHESLGQPSSLLLGNMRYCHLPTATAFCHLANVITFCLTLTIVSFMMVTTTTTTQPNLPHHTGLTGEVLHSNMKTTVLETM